MKSKTTKINMYGPGGGINKAAAIRLGLSFYNTGLPCRGGHYADRYVSNGGCVACIRKPVQPRPSVSGARVCFDCTPEMKEAIKANAIAFKMTISQYMRYIVDSW